MNKPPVSLKGLAEAKTDGIQKATYFKVHPDLVEFEEGFNLREEGPDLDEHIDRLAAAMMAGAFIPPIDVSVIGGRIVARDGHCRTRAARKLLEAGVEYQLEARQLRGNDADAVIHMLGSGQGKNFTPLEQGRGFLRLLRFGFDVATIAQRTGLHRSTIENGLTLAEAPQAVQALIASGKVASSFALQTLRKHGTLATGKLEKAVERAEQAGQRKATAKHARTEPQPVALPPDVEPLRALAERIAALSPLETYPGRDIMVELIKEARRLVGEPG